ncbi:MAG: cyclic nucleotide-binding domain-containing protein [Desulfovibrionales bacterium]
MDTRPDPQSPGRPNILSFEKGEDVLAQGDPAEHVFIIISGNIQVVRDDDLLTIFSSQNILGIEGLYNQSGTYPYTARAETACRLVKYQASDFLDSLFQTPRLTELTFSSLARQLDLCWQKAGHSPGSGTDLFFSGEIRTYEPGDWIIREGEETTEIYRIISTERGVEVSKGGQILAVLDEPGEIFGEMASVLRERRTASVKSIGQSVLEVYAQQQLLGVLSDYSDVSLRIIRSLSRRLAETSRLAAESKESKRAD